jgi:uncharacterized membrane protein YphA (DoxX/SURF4 family)
MTRPTPTVPASLGLLILRVVVGVGLMHHGIDTLFGTVPAPEQPAATTSEDTAPPAVPGEETPGEVTPGEEAPGEETPGEVTPGEEAPGEETPGEVTPAEEAPAEEAPAEAPAPQSRIARFQDFVAKEFDFLPEPRIWALVAKWTELAGGALLLLGLLTRVAALFAAGTMGFAVYLHWWVQGLPFFVGQGETGGSFELAALYGAGAACLLLCGAGRLSIDRMLLGKGPHDEDEPPRTKR